MMFDVLGWLVLLIDVAAALAFVVAAVVWAKRIGGAAPWMLAAIAGLDGLLILLSRVLATTTRSAAYGHYDDVTRMWNVFGLLDATTSFASGALALVAFALLMPKTPR
jgi:hypothetical protein